MANYWFHLRLWALALLAAGAGSSACWGQARPRPFGVAQGMPQNGVSDLAIDLAGRLWGGTMGGAFRYDGQRFETFGPHQGLPTTQVKGLATGPDGTVWLNHSEGRLSCYRAGRGRVLRRFNGQLGGPRYLWAGALPGGGTDLWLLSERSEHGELLRLRLGPGPDTTLTRYPAAALGVPPGTAFAGLGPGPDGQLWVVSGAGLCVLDRLTGRRLPAAAPPVPAGAVVRQVWCVADTLAWLATSQGLVRARRGPAQPWRCQLLGAAQGLPADGPAYAAAQDRAGRSWVETTAGLYVGRPGRSWVLADSVAVEGHTATLLPDAEGNLWRRTANGLTQYLADEQCQRVGPAQGQPQPDVMALASAPGGSWYVGGVNGLVRYWPAGPRQAPRAERIALPQAWAMGAIYAVLADRRGGLWVAAYLEGVARYEPATGRWWVPPWSSPQASQGGFAEDRRGRLWLRGAAGGVACYDPATDRLTTQSLQRRPTDARGAHCFFRDRRGRLWVAGGSYGLFWLDEPAGVLRPASGLPDPGPVPLVIQAMADDAAGNLWLGVGGDGLRRYDGHRLWPVSAGASGPAPTSVWALPSGRLWLGTFRGLDLFDPATDERRHFGAAEGLTDNACTFGALRPDSLGRLWVGAEDGLYVVDPARAATARPPVVELTGLRVDRHDTTLVPGLSLPYDRNQLTFRFIGVSLSDPTQVRYRYRLAGLQATWQPVAASTEATFTSLPAGHYRFELQAANANGRWSAQPASYAFAIRPAWWATAWFRALSALALAAGLYGLYRLRLRQALAVERLRLSIARDLHDDVGSTLSSISILSQLAASPASSGSPAPLLTQIGESARQTLAAMDDIVWAINPAHDQPQDLSARLRHHAAELLESRGLALHFAAAPPPPGLKLPMQTRREVFLIFKELLHNTTKYAQAGQVRVTLRFAPRRLELELGDDGCGFDPAAPAQGSGQGLPNVRARAALLGGTLALDTAPGRGTHWRLVVPV